METSRKNTAQRPPDAHADKITERFIGKLFPDLRSFAIRFERILPRFDPETPRTSIAQAERLFDSFAVRIEGQQRLVLFLMRKAVKSKRFREAIDKWFDDLIQTAKREASTDKRYSLLIKLAHEVDEVIPFAGGQILMRRANLVERFTKQMSPVPFMERASNLSGEKRMNAVVEAFRRTVDHLYDDYITTLVLFAYVRELKPEEEYANIPGMRLGTKLDVVSSKLPDYKRLYHANIATMRNALTHDVPTYLRESDTLILMDRNKPPMSITVEELMSLADDVYQLSARTVVLVSQLYLFREFFRDTGLFAEIADFFPQLVSERDPEKMNELSAEFEKRMAAKFSPDS